MQLTTTAVARTLIGLSLLVAPLACNSGPRATTRSSAATTQVPHTPDRSFHVDARQAVGYLASDELEGRGIDTDGINKAADYIANAFEKLGLVPMGDDGTYFQHFKTTISTKLGEGTSLSAKLEADKEPTKYDLKQGFYPVRSGAGTFEGDVVFAGYGISNPHGGYDDYEGLDVKGKVVLILRYDPHDEKGNSRFTKVERKDETDNSPGTWSSFAGLDDKAKAAADHGAVALAFVNPPTFHRGDVLQTMGGGFAGPKDGLPLIQVTQGVADQWLKAAGSKADLKALQASIDAEGKPVKAELTQAVRVAGKIDIEREQRDVKNVVALLPGTDRSDSREYVVVGAHYDHLGRGGEGSLARLQKNEIHNGADDNASGTTAMLKVAEQFAKSASASWPSRKRAKRSMLFCAFTAEEEGLIGSRYLVDHPPVPLEKVVAMLNLDMVGRVTSEQLSVGGKGTAPSLAKIVADADRRSPLVLKDIGEGGLGPSDHASFALKKVPVLFLFSGLHADYHRPTDDADKVNYKGMEQVVTLAVDITNRLLKMPKETYVTAADAHSMSMGSGAGGMKATLGIIPVYGSDPNVKGCEIDGATAGSPAEKAGLKDGDVIVKWDQTDIADLEGLTECLRRGKPGDVVKLKVKRGAETIDIEATLAERKS